MIKTRMVVAGILIVASSAVSSALAQSRENGCVFPLIYDREGLRHFHVNLYYGPLAPPLAPEEIVVKISHQNHTGVETRPTNGGNERSAFDVDK
jgi:hypothetical protein